MAGSLRRATRATTTAPAFALALALALTLTTSRPVAAQQLEPRAYSPSPVGVNFVGLGYAHSSGDVLLDASLPLSDVTARLDIASPFYQHTFGLFGRAASVGAVLPYAWGTVEGNLNEAYRRADRAGPADVPLRLAVNLVGGPALAPREFAARKLTTSLGASLVVSAPTGQYDPAKLINLGANRWAFKPELGFSQPWRRWWLEAYAGVWVFTDNDDFFGGQHREQDPLGVAQAHLVRSFPSRIWAAFDATYYYGGETAVDGVAKADRQKNSRLGVTLALPVKGAHSIKLAWAKGVTARVGSNLQTLAVAWQYRWF